MASAITHAVVGAGIGLAAAALPSARGTRTRRLILLGVSMAVLPDGDVITFAWVDYEHLLGHRGLFHAPAFYVALGALVALLHDRESRRVVFVCTFVALLSHSLLDALTDGGLGVAFFAPLSAERYFFPWRPIPVSPIGVRAFFTARGLHILSVEAFFAVPALALGYLVYRSRSGDGGNVARR